MTTTDRHPIPEHTPDTTYIIFRANGREYTAHGTEIDRLISQVMTGKIPPLDITEQYICR